MSPKSTTTWTRESARLAFFAVAMSERRDPAMLGLIEQANNAVESYLGALKAFPPSLFATQQAASAPTPPSPQPKERPLSITGAHTPDSPPRSNPWPLGAASASVPPLQPKSTSADKGKTPVDVSTPVPPRLGRTEWTLPTEMARQYCVAFAAIEPHISSGIAMHLAVLDVCSGRDVYDAADDRQVDSQALKASLMRLRAIGPKAYLDSAAGIAP